MPAKHFHRSTDANNISYVYNSGVDNKIIFAEEADYTTFLKYLEEYLSPVVDPSTLKTSFTINGHTFKGTPHLPKNYHNRVKLIAFSLQPSQFQLILNQTKAGSQAMLLRSLCTRYSMYFNKKYKRKGSLFEGPYKSMQVTDLSELPILSTKLHLTHDGIPNIHSSYEYYIGVKNALWVDPEPVLSKVNDYKALIKQNKPNIKTEQNNYSVINTTISMSHKPDIKNQSEVPRLKTPLFMGFSTFLFIVLFSVGLNNVWSYSPVLEVPDQPKVAGVTIEATITPAPIPSPSPAPEVTPAISPTPSPTPVAPLMRIVIQIQDGSVTVNLRELPNISSQIVGTTQNGDTYNVVSTESGWYKIDINDGYAFISSKYAKPLESEQN